jgi:hypothetical protein
MLVRAGFLFGLKKLFSCTLGNKKKKKKNLKKKYQEVHVLLKKKKKDKHNNKIFSRRESSNPILRRDSCAYNAVIATYALFDNSCLHGAYCCRPFEGKLAQKQLDRL